MSTINPALLAQAFSPTAGGIDLEKSPGNALAQSLVRTAAGDNVTPTFSLPGLPSPIGPPGNGGGFGLFGGQNGLGGIIASLLGGLDNLLQALVGLFSGSNMPGPSPQPLGGETPFANANASSVGDPHDAFHGTSAAGASVGGKWDSMTSHGNLLSSDSFSGGYRVSTTVTAPNANGVTLNAHANIATDGGRTNVGMNADGSYNVSSFGRNVNLVTGQAVQLDQNESVTLNADKSLTVNETNAGGGSISTTLRRNGSGGVDVASTAQNVDLGGYLVNKSDADADPVALAGGQYGPYGQYGNPSGGNTDLPLVAEAPPQYGFTMPEPAMSSMSGSTSMNGSFAVDPYQIEES